MKGKELMVRDHGQVEPVHQADNDAQVIAMWLHGRPHTTQRAYAYEVQRAPGRRGQAPGSDHPGGSPGLFLYPGTPGPGFPGPGHQCGQVPIQLRPEDRLPHFQPRRRHPGSPKIKNTLAERILPEAQVHRLLALEPHPRNRVLLRLMYAAGLRVSEVCGLKWRDVQEREGAGQITVYGKGGKTRVVLLSPDTWTELISLKGEGGADEPVFASRKGKGHLHPSQVNRIVQAAANRAGIEACGFPPLATPCPCQPCPGPGRTDPPGSGHPGPCLGSHHGQISSCPA